MKRSPFIYNAPVPPTHFIGRTQQVDQILDQLANPARVSSAISGDPQVGKTSLLHYIGMPEVHEAWSLSSGWCYFLYVDCQSIISHNFSEVAFWRHILRELEPYLHDIETLSQFVRQIGSQPDPDIFDLNSLFDQIARAKRLVVLMLDEFEGVVENLHRQNSPALLHHLRALLNRPERGLVLIVASRSPLQQLCANIQFAGSPFDNSFSSINLPPFNEAEIDELLIRYQVEFSAEERAFLSRLAGPHPYLIQLAGSLIWRMRQHHHPSAETHHLLFETDFERKTEGYFAEILSYTNRVEQMLLTWLALTQLIQQMPSNTDRLGKLPQTLGRYDPDFNRLVRRGLVQLVDGEPRVFSSVFGRWILRTSLVAAGQEVLTGWRSCYSHFLSQIQQEAFEALARIVIDQPAVIAKPELLGNLLHQNKEKPAPSSPVGSTRTIRLSGSVLPVETEKKEIIKYLYAKSNQDIVQVRLEQELTSGLSGAQVFLAQPIDNQDRELAYEVVKIAPATMLRRENSRYRQFVKGRLPATAVRLESGPVEEGMWGCLSYGFAGDRPIGAIADLETYYAAHSSQEVIDALSHLMDSMDRRWYGQSRPLSVSFADEYGQQLPDHLRLRDAQIIPGNDVTNSAYPVIKTETILNEHECPTIGDRVTVTGLQVSQVMPNDVKLYSTGDGSIVWIRAKVNTPTPDLQEQEPVTVSGIVEACRDDVLTTTVTNIFRLIPDLRLGGEGILFLQDSKLAYPHPLSIYKRLLRQPLAGRKSIIHGDLHPGNILVDETGRAWLIDFDHVREGHILFDFVRFETLFRLFILGRLRYFGKEDQALTISSENTHWPHGFSLAEYAAFERSLIQQTFNQPAETITQPDLSKTAEVIMAIRDLAQGYLRRRNGWREYFIALFLQNLAQLRHYQELPWLGVLPFTTATIVGGDISDRR